MPAPGLYTDLPLIPPRVTRGTRTGPGGQMRMVASPVFGDDALSAVVRATTMEWYGQVLQSSWMQYEASRSQQSAPRPGYRVHEDAAIAPFLKMFPDEFDEVQSEDEARMVAITIGNNMRNRQQQMAFNDGIVPGLVAGIVDPTNFVPIPFLKGGLKIGSVAGRFSAGATASMATLGTTMLISEKIRSELDPTSSELEDRLRISAGLLFTTALGGVAGIAAFRPRPRMGSPTTAARHVDERYNRLLTGMDEGARITCQRTVGGGTVRLAGKTAAAVGRKVASKVKPKITKAAAKTKQSGVDVLTRVRKTLSKYNN